MMPNAIVILPGIKESIVNINLVLLSQHIWGSLAAPTPLRCYQLR